MSEWFSSTYVCTPDARLVLLKSEDIRLPGAGVMNDFEAHVGTTYGTLVL